MSQNNPANTPDKAMATRERIPMSLPVLKLAVPDIPGYHLHWMRGEPGRLAQAQRAGYEFVNADEVDVPNTGLADDASESGNTDMGTRVSLVSGPSADGDGQPNRLYLMKIKQEYWVADQKILEDKNEQMAATLRGGSTPGGANDGMNYIPASARRNVENLFTKKS